MGALPQVGREASGAPPEDGRGRRAPRKESPTRASLALSRSPRARRGAVAVLVVAATSGALPGCARARRASGSDEPTDDRPPPVAVVAGEGVSKAALSDFLHDRFREAWAKGLDLLIDERLAAVEGARLGATVPGPTLDRAVAVEVAAREESARAQGVDLAATVREAYGRDLEAWKRDVLRPRIATRLLLERVVRRSSRSRDQVVVRVLVVRDPARARALLSSLATGADFGLLALQESEDPSKAEGGLLPPIVRGDLARKDLEGRLFGAGPGSLVGPFEISGPRGPETHLYKVVERIAPWSPDPAVTSRLVEEDLVKNPVGRSEYERWAARARRDAGVRYFAPDGSPLRLPE